jgi:ABC-type polysaccharide/polyol phosphate export permease
LRSLNIHKNSSLGKAVSDIRQGLKLFPLWSSLAWQDIRQRYKRSLLGPFWITASTGVMILAMGPLYGALLGQNVSDYIKYLSVSMIIWSFISTCINEAGSVFISSEGYIKQVPLPFSIYVFRLIARNILILLHNVLIVFVVLIVFPSVYSESLFLVPIGLFLVTCNLFWIVLLIGLLSTRFRDIPQLVSNVVQVAFFLSPIIWKVDMLNVKSQYLANINPLYHFMEVIRAPLFGEPFRNMSWTVTLSSLIAGSIFTFFVFTKYRSRITYWL